MQLERWRMTAEVIAVSKRLHAGRSIFSSFNRLDAHVCSLLIRNSQLFDEARIRISDAQTVLAKSAM